VERLHRAIGPLATNVHILADERSGEAIAIDTAIPSLTWIAAELEARSWTLKLIVSSHGHWDHIGDNARVAAHTGADVAVHPLDADRLADPHPLWAPFEIPPSVAAVELAEGGEVRFGAIRLRVLHTPGHTAGSVSLLAADDGLLFSGDTAAMVDSLDRLRTLADDVTVLPGHGPSTTLGRERPWLDWVARERRLPT
jgi:hydroxyacylglutathione hydrolase